MKFLESFKLFERKNNYQLFHKTKALEKILKSGYIIAGGDETDSFPWWNFDVRKNVISNWKENKFISISATRNLHYFGLPALEFDVEKLSDKYKILPFSENPDYYLDFDQKKMKPNQNKKFGYFQNRLRTKTKEAGELYWRVKTDKGAMDYGISEEIILTDKIDISKYVKRIILDTPYNEFDSTNNNIIKLIHEKYPNIEVVEINVDGKTKKSGYYKYISVKKELKDKEKELKDKEKELTKDIEVAMSERKI